MFEWVKRLTGNTELPQIDEAQWHPVERELPFLSYLPVEAIYRARKLAAELLRHKQFYGANGLELSDRIMLSIALQACLPILRLGVDAYKGWVGVVVYPGDFLVNRKVLGADGVVHEFEDTLLGEARADGPVLVSWFDEAGRSGGVNVVIHEFAHKLDMLDGDADGLPILAPGMRRDRWAEAFVPAYEDFCRRVDRGEQTAIDPYASENPAEFLAVTLETFFMAPLRLQMEYPQVYAQLSSLCGVDPAEGEARLIRERWLTSHATGR